MSEEKPSWEWRAQVEALEKERRRLVEANEYWHIRVEQMKQQLAEAMRGQPSCEPGLSRDGLLVLLDSIKRGDDTAIAIIVAEWDRMHQALGEAQP